MTATTVSSSYSVQQVNEKTSGVPWYLWWGAIAVTSSVIGGEWDVSWHRSIGRDTFWTPAHIAIYACGVIAAIICGYLMLVDTFGREARLRGSSVRVLGVRAPIGAFIAAWGGIAMLTSAPFDNWWHAAYGLDVKIVSPPHTLLILGIRAVTLGVLFLILSELNRTADASGEHQGKKLKTLQALFLYVGGLTVGGQMFFLMEYTMDPFLHQAGPYIAIGISVPILFAILSQASRYAWAATATAAIPTLFGIIEILILPLFPAQPKLGPVFYPVTHMVPARFPVLIIFPAIALDLIWQRTRGWKPWKIALLSGIVFIAVLTAVEWPFANFLMSKASQNRFFGTGYFDYYSHATGLNRLRAFATPDHGLVLLGGLLRAMFYSFITIWMGLRFGRWIKDVKR